MAKFALACEGVTDQIVIENILCGFYKDYDDLDEEIQPLQPPFDATTQKHKEGEFGGWERLLEYLSLKRFRDDVLNSEYVIIQIDTDIFVFYFTVLELKNRICWFYFRGALYPAINTHFIPYDQFQTITYK